MNKIEVSGYVRADGDQWYIESEKLTEEYGADFLTGIDEMLESFKEDVTHCGDYIKVTLEIQRDGSK